MNKPIEKIGIIGSGKMGSDLFSYLDNYPFDLYWVGEHSVEMSNLRDKYVKKIERQNKYGLISNEVFLRKKENNVFTSDLSVLSNCHLIVEAIWENPIEKIELIRKLNMVVYESAIIASNSSSILPSILGKHFQYPENFIGLHFFFPIQMKNIVEVICSEHTSSFTLNQIKDFCGSIDRKFLIQDSSNAFLLNKIALEIQNEAFEVLSDQNLSHSVLDNAVKSVFPIGVFDFFDSVGIDIMCQSILNYASQINTNKYDSLISLLKKYVDNNQLGQKTNVGFYTYPIQSIHEELIDKEIMKSVSNRILNAYICAAENYSEAYNLDKNSLNFALKEYFGMELGPFDFK